MENVKVVQLRSFDFIGEAEIVKGLLEANDIRCSLVHDTVQTVLPYLSAGVYPIEIMVAEPDLERAQEIMNSKFDQAEFDRESLPKKRAYVRKKKE